MSERRILTIGFQLASADVQHESFTSKTSLLDWDIVLFSPNTSDFYSGEQYLGKTCLDDTSSFRLRESCEHWRREIKQAVEAGKTVIVYLAPLREVYVATGERRHSGTGRNQKTTRIVDIYSNYKAVPASLSPVAASGSSMKLSSKGAELLKSYWIDFESLSKYEVTLNGEKMPAAILTRTGDKVVGAVYRTHSSLGSLILLPNIEFSSGRFVSPKGNWTKEAQEICARLIAHIVALDKFLRSAGEATPAPVWAGDEEYLMPEEQLLGAQLLEAERKVEEAQKRKEALQAQLRDAGSLRDLLFEKGKPLENSIINALRLLEFRAEPFSDSDSEFDVVFEAEEGRLIGEAEGKDSKPINIDKLRQLAMNIHEDLQREDVEIPAKPVLFGNAYRLTQPSDRGESFTDKCRSAAAASSTALVATPDLFRVAQYLSAGTDTDYAKACRNAILNTTGLVDFPQIPKASQSEEVTEGP